LISGTNALARCISSEIKYDRKINATAVFFHMHPVSHITTKIYEQKPRKERDGVLSCFMLLTRLWDRDEKRIEAIDQGR
jgi:hypothetical protein